MDFLIALQALDAQFRLDFGCRPVIGVEIECYVNSPDASDLEPVDNMDALLKDLESALRESGISLYDVLQERGDNQLEVALKEQEEMQRLSEQIALTKKTIRKWAIDQDLEALFAAKPFRRHPGSGLHIHVSMKNDKGNNVFFKKNDMMSLPLKHALGGLMAAMTESMPVYAPKAASYQRFSGEDPEAPCTVSWGGNNRTTSLRLPDDLSGHRHIEHRVPGVDADPLAAIFVTLAAIHHGMAHQLEPGEQIYGNAFLPQYNLPFLPQTLEAAQQAMHEGTILQPYLGDSWAGFAGS